MPQAILEYSLPDDEDEFAAAVRALTLVACVQEYDTALRGVLKYETDASQDFIQGVQFCRDSLWQHLKDSKLDELFS
jgi:hypothetical protein